MKISTLLFTTMLAGSSVFALGACADDDHDDYDDHEEYSERYDDDYDDDHHGYCEDDDDDDDDDHDDYDDYDDDDCERKNINQPTPTTAASNPLFNENSSVTATQN